MEKVVVINSCRDCPHFDNSYYDYAEVCQELGRKISLNQSNWDYDIPTDCPLKTVEEFKNCK